MIDYNEKDEDGIGDEDDYYKDYKIKVDSEKNDYELDERDSFTFSEENDNNNEENIIEMAKEPIHSE